MCSVELDADRSAPRRRIAEVRRALEAVGAGFDAGGLSGREALAVVRDLGVVRKLADALAGKAAVRVEETAAHRDSGDRSAADALAKAFGVDAGEARRTIETAGKVAGLDATDAAVRAGRLSAREARLVVEAAAADPAAEGALLTAAAKGLQPLRDACLRVRAGAEDPCARARRQHASRSLRWWTDEDGMVAGAIRLAPEAGGPVRRWFDAAVQRVFRARRAGEEHEPHEAYAADALVALVRSERREAEGAGTDAVVSVDAGAARPVRVRRGVDATVHVLVDHAALVRGGTAEGEVCEIAGVGPVDVAWARSLLGEAFLTVVVRKGKDIRTVAHLGRHVPAEVRTALVASGRECDVEGCSVRGYLERDHDREYARGGPTSWENLGWLCAAHHRRKTAGWRLGARDPATRKRTLTPPAGSAGAGRRRAGAA